MRPKFGSPPCSAVLTRGWSWRSRARPARRASDSPLDDDPPDPLGPLAVGDDLHCQLSHHRVDRLPESQLVIGLGPDPDPGGAVRDREHGVAGRELPVDADPIERSLDAHPGEQVERLRQTSRHRSATKQNIVAKRGEIIPAPFAWADSRTVPARQRRPRRTPAWVRGRWSGSRVRMHRRRRRTMPTAARTPAQQTLARQLRPDHPRRGDADLRRLDPEQLGGKRLGGPRGVEARCRRRRCSSRPSWRRRRAGGQGRPARDAITGAPTRALVVNRAALTASGASQPARPTSSPDGFSPAATPAARNPWASRRRRELGHVRRLLAPTARRRTRLTRSLPPPAARTSG